MHLPFCLRAGMEPRPYIRTLNIFVGAGLCARPLCFLQVFLLNNGTFTHRRYQIAEFQ